MNRIVLFCLLLCFALPGCSDSNPHAAEAQNPSKAEVDSAKARRDEIFAIYDRAGGKWESMTPEDRRRLVELSGGDEGKAMTGWGAIPAMRGN